MYNKSRTLASTNSYPTGMGPAVLDTWMECVCNKLCCEISALDDSMVLVSHSGPAK